MAKLRWIAGIVLVLLVASGAYSVISRRMASARFSSQVYGEVPDAPKSFVLKPGQAMTLGPPHSAGNVRYDVASSMPVNTGLMVSGGRWPRDAICYEAQVLASVKSCKVDPPNPQWIVVADTRTSSDVVAGAIFGNQQVIADNKVTVTIYHWGCARNCCATLDCR
ncbi:MAG: hypothetical protein LAO20_14360 [Acidobacteriia bacterium]|nr:hypothetical protein [Terriglobia bacterium]